MHADLEDGVMHAIDLAIDTISHLAPRATHSTEQQRASTPACSARLEALAEPRESSCFSSPRQSLAQLHAVPRQKSRNGLHREWDHDKFIERNRDGLVRPSRGFPRLRAEPNVDRLLGADSDDVLVGDASSRARIPASSSESVFSEPSGISATSSGVDLWRSPASRDASSRTSRPQTSYTASFAMLERAAAFPGVPGMAPTPPRRRPSPPMPALTPTGSPRIIQSGSKAFDRWRLKTAVRREAAAVRDVPPATDIHTEPNGIKYRNLVLMNPKREMEREKVRQRAAREVEYVKAIVTRSVTYYPADDTAKIRGEKRNAYQAELRRHQQEAIQRENVKLFRRILEAASKGAEVTRPSEFSLNHTGLRLGASAGRPNSTR